MKALALVSTSAWWVKGRRKVRASPVLQTLLLLFMLLAMFGPLLNLLIWTVAESWYFPHSLPSRWGLKYWYQVFNPYSDVSSSLLTSVLIALFRCHRDDTSIFPYHFPIKAVFHFNQ